MIGGHQYFSFKTYVAMFDSARSVALDDSNDMVNHYGSLINQFLSAQASFRARWLWPKILMMSYPSLHGLSLDRMILCLVLRGLKNQASGAAVDFCEYFCGSAWLTHEMLSSGFTGFAFDNRNGPGLEQDCLTSRGLRLYFDTICLVKKYGLIWIATPCSSFTVLCRYQSQRLPSNNFLGEEDSYSFVKTGNALCEISALMFFLSYLLSVWAVIEQPLNSCMFDTPSMMSVLSFSRAMKHTTWMGAYDGPTAKPLQIWSTWHAVGQLERPKPIMLNPASLVTRSEQGAFTGNKGMLEESQIYTQSFGRAMTEICLREWGS